MTMAYIYQIGFDIRPDQMGELEIGASLERVLGFLLTLLPNEEGYITARAMHSIDTSEAVTLVVESVWDNWEEFKKHAKSATAEDKVLLEFAPHLDQGSLRRRIYEEVS
jgi:quinol monooxygenase YgiN